MVALVARPKVLSDEATRARILRYFKLGASIEIACGAAGISTETFYGLKRRAKEGNAEAWEMEFLEEIQHACFRGDLSLVKNIKRAAKLPKFWKANQYLLEARARGSFAALNVPPNVAEPGTAQEHASRIRADLDAMDASISAPAAKTEDPKP